MGEGGGGFAILSARLPVPTVARQAICINWSKWLAFSGGLPLSRGLKFKTGPWTQTPACVQGQRWTSRSDFINSRASRRPPTLFLSPAGGGLFARAPAGGAGPGGFAAPAPLGASRRGRRRPRLRGGVVHPRRRWPGARADHRPGACSRAACASTTGAFTDLGCRYFCRQRHARTRAAACRPRCEATPIRGRDVTRFPVVCRPHKAEPWTPALSQFTAVVFARCPSPPFPASGAVTGQSTLTPNLPALRPRTARARAIFLVRTNSFHPRLP